MTTKSSQEIVAALEENSEAALFRVGVDAKYSRAKSVEQTIEHSMGVTETFKKACRFAHDGCDCEYSPVSYSGSDSSAPAGKSSLSIDCKY